MKSLPSSTITPCASGMPGCRQTSRSRSKRHGIGQEGLQIALGAACGIVTQSHGITDTCHKPVRILDASAWHANFESVRRGHSQYAPMGPVSNPTSLDGALHRIVQRPPRARGPSVQHTPRTSGEAGHSDTSAGDKTFSQPTVWHILVYSTLDRQCYTTVPVYLQMVTDWRDRKWMAQLRSGSHWLGEETGRHIGQPREQRLCRRCKCGAIDDAAHMVFHCAALTAQRRRYPQLFLAAGGDLRAFYQ